MRPYSFFAATLAIVAAGSGMAHDPPPVNAPYALGAMVTAQGPLAVSGDGHWRVHVDGANVLHRIRLVDRAEIGRIAMPIPVATLRLNHDGRRGALLSESGCIGIIDFSGEAQLRWAILNGASLRWTDSPPTGCTLNAEDLQAQREQPDDHFGLRVIAISDDGRLVATRVGVIDVQARRVIARLPQTWLAEDTPATLPTELRFLEGGKRLLALVAALGPPSDRYDGYHAPLLQAAVWDLETRHLLQLRDVPTSSDTGTGLVASVNPDTGIVWSVDAQPGAEPAFTLLRTPIASCRGQPERVAPIGAPMAQWIGDPHQRWLAQLQWPRATLAGQRTAGGMTLRVVALSGTTLLRVESDRDVEGIVAAPDGSKIYGLRMPPASQKWPPVVSYGGDVVEWQVTGLAAPASLQPAAWPTRACADGREAPRARDVVPVAQTIVAAWERRIPAVETRRTRVDLDASGGGHCSNLLLSSMPPAAFMRLDGTVWLDTFDRFEQLDLATGRTLALEKTVRKPGTCVMPMPRVGGSIAWAGDTLNVHAFGTNMRRSIDVRPGWQVRRIAQGAGRLLVQWIPKAGTFDVMGGGSEDSGFLPFHDVAYDMHGWRVISDELGHDDPESEGSDPSADLYVESRPGLCRTPDGGLRTGWDMEVAFDDAFRSLRGVACDPALPEGRGQTLLRTGMDLEPAGTALVGGVRTAVASDEAISIVQEGHMLRVFDVPHRAELGRVALAHHEIVVAVHVSASSGWIVVDTMEGVGQRFHHIVRGYAISR